MADQPTTTPSTPQTVRDLEAKAIRLYRYTYPTGTPWHELADETRQMWIVHTEQQLTIRIKND